MYTNGDFGTRFQPMPIAYHWHAAINERLEKVSYKIPSFRRAGQPEIANIMRSRGRRDFLSRDPLLAVEHFAQQRLDSNGDPERKGVF